MKREKIKSEEKKWFFFNGKHKKGNRMKENKSMEDEQEKKWNEKWNKIQLKRINK